MSKTDLYFASQIGQNVFLQHRMNDVLGRNRVIRQNITKGTGSRGWDGQN